MAVQKPAAQWTKPLYLVGEVVIWIREAFASHVKAKDSINPSGNGTNIKPEWCHANSTKLWDMASISVGGKSVSPEIPRRDVERPTRLSARDASTREQIVGDEHGERLGDRGRGRVERESTTHEGLRGGGAACTGNAARRAHGAPPIG